MRVLVTAATKYGATGEIAQAIGAVLSERGLDTTVASPEQVQAIDDYDAVVLGSAVYAGHWLTPAKEFVDRCRDALAARPVWLFSSGPIGDPPKPEEDPVDVAEILQKATGDVQLEIARRLERISLMPVPQPVLDLEAVAGSVAANVVLFPVVAPIPVEPAEPFVPLVQLARTKPVQLALFGSML